MTSAKPIREIGKSKLAMYLRTKCDRELYLSLFSNSPAALKTAGLPIPLKSRPGVQLITKAGYEFEYEQFDQLIAKLPNNVIHARNGRAPLDLAPALEKAHPKSFILQPAIEPETLRKTAFDNLGVSAESQKYIPPIKGMRPDILYVGEPASAAFEVLPTGKRRHVDKNDPRRPLHVIDLKNITEANASYSAEVCLYAFFLSNWLDMQSSSLKSSYYVSDEVYLWRHVEMPRFSAIMSTKEGGDHNNRITALLEDLHDGLVTYLVYMPSVVKFFVEDVPRVVKLGDDQGWQAVEYHVNPRCGSCDWLGNKSWLSPTDEPIFAANPEHYCFHNAEAVDHLSKMPTLSKGAARVLGKGGHAKVADLVGIAANADTLKRHTILKKDRKQIGARAEALVKNSTSVDNISKIGTLAQTWNAEYDIVVNFDAGSGFLTGIAVRGVLSAPFGQRFDDAEPSSTLKFLGDAAFVVPQDNPTAEWSQVLGFLNQLAEWIDETEATFRAKGWNSVRTQICFWEPRQYEELCNAFSRHLLQMLDLSNKSQKALAWVFPADELIEKDGEICPSIVFIKDVISSSVMLPQRFATTLLGTAEHYHHTKLLPRSVDKYYVEPLGNGIPRERIFEIWKSTTGTVRIYGKDIGIPEACDRYGSVLRAQAYALGSITARLRQDLKGALTGKAAILKLSIPQGMNRVAQDSKLWEQWNVVSAATKATKGKLNLIKRQEWLEASYEAIVLTSVITDHGSHRYTFQVNDESTESKIEEGDSYCTVGISTWPGFPLQSAQSLSLNVDENSRSYRIPMHQIISATVERFDRANKTALVAFRCGWDGWQDAFDAVTDAGIIPIGKEPIYLMEKMPYDESYLVREILLEIGNPKCAKTAPQALSAMGKSAAKRLSPGTDTDTPIARVLWSGDKLSKTAIRSSSEAKKLADDAKKSSPHGLNASQYEAVRECATSQLSIIWGPPGTGKTDTLASLIHAVVKEGKQRKILLTGPNYRTAEELASRVLNNLNGDKSAACDFYWVYSKSREPKDAPPASSHINLRSFSMSSPDDVTAMVRSYSNTVKTTIVATTAHVVDRVVKELTSDGKHIEPLFDLVVLDESSQIPVTLALRPLSSLRDNAQLIVAGDHLQMPPIHDLEPPLDAEYLVSGIQTYLIERFGIPQQKLLINYRSNQDLVDYARTLGYPSELTAHNKVKQLRILRPVEDVITSLPEGLPITDAYRILLDPNKRVAALIHDDPVSSQANEVEAALVAGLAYSVRQSMAKNLDIGDAAKPAPFDDDTFFDKGIGIVTPHKAQKALVVRALLELFPSADKEKVYASVDTVERFQGGERHTIIVSFGVGDTDIIEGEEAFLLQMERTNVAVSRAMAKCIVLMPKSLAYHLPSDIEAARASVAIKSYIEEFCVNRAAIDITFDGTTRHGEVRWR